MFFFPTQTTFRNMLCDVGLPDFTDGCVETLVACGVMYPVSFVESTGDAVFALTPTSKPKKFTEDVLGHIFGARGENDWAGIEKDIMAVNNRALVDRCVVMMGADKSRKKAKLVAQGHSDIFAWELVEGFVTDTPKTTTENRSVVNPDCGCVAAKRGLVGFFSGVLVDFMRALQRPVKHNSMPQYYFDNEYLFGLDMKFSRGEWTVEK